MSSKVLYIRDDGGLEEANEFTTNYFEDIVLPAGPSTFADAITTFQTLKKNNIPPFLVVVPNSMNWTLNISPQILWTDAGSGGLDWSVWRIKDGIINKTTNARDYICLGDTAIWTNGEYTYMNDMLKSPWLYAHKSICYRVPGRSIFAFDTNRQFYEPNVSSGPNEVSLMYHGLGIYATDNCTAVLRAFVIADDNIYIKNGVWENSGGYFFLNQCARGFTTFLNTLTVKQATDWSTAKLDANFSLLNSVQEAVDNLMDCVLYHSTDQNAEFQNIIVTQTKERRSDVVMRVMKALCDSDLDLSKYPEICACLGRKGVEDALKVELQDSTARFVCLSSACTNTANMGRVFTFEPSPPCAPINICRPGMNINAANLTMTNVAFDCRFTDPGESSSSLSTPAPGLTMNYKIAVGASVAVMALLVLVIAVVVAYRLNQPKLLAIKKQTQ